MASIFNLFPVELKMQIVSYLNQVDKVNIIKAGRSDWADIARPEIMSNISFALHEDRQHERQSSPCQVLKFLRKIMFDQVFRSRVRTLHLDFGCYCRDTNPWHRQQFVHTDRPVLDAVSALWSTAPAVIQNRVTGGRLDLQMIFHRFTMVNMDMRNPHEWYCRCFMLMLCLVPHVQHLHIRMREYGNANPHGTLIEHDITMLAQHIANQGLLTNIRSLSLRRWNESLSAPTNLQPFPSLLFIPHLHEIDVDSALLHRIPRSNVLARKVTIHAPPTAYPLNTGTDLQTFLERCRDVETINIRRPRI